MMKKKFILFQFLGSHLRNSIFHEGHNVITLDKVYFKIIKKKNL